MEKGEEEVEIQSLPLYQRKQYFALCEKFFLNLTA